MPKFSFLLFSKNSNICKIFPLSETYLPCICW